MGKTYFNDGITGNGRLLVSFTGNGEVNRVFWPAQDYAQQINHIWMGFKFDDSITKFLHENLWYVEQYYDGKSNVLVTSYENSDFGLKIIQRDFALNDSDVWVRHYSVENICERELCLKAFLHTDFVSADNNVRSGIMNFESNCATIYNKDHAVTIGSGVKLSGFQFGSATDAIINDCLYGKDEISMTSDMGLKWDLGELLPNKKIEFDVFFCFDYDYMKSVEIFEKLKDENGNFLIEREKKFWEDEFLKYNKFVTGNEQIDDVYFKSILTFKLLTNADTGAILAAVEVDEGFTRCGRYGYCWPRDGVFITKAFDLCGMSDEAERFYTVWAKKAQLNNGSWQQRYYLDGKLAPSWGVQIDEIAAIIYGAWEHFEYTRKLSFLEEIWSSVKQAAIYLMNHLDADTGLPVASYDLWEERFGEHTYSAAAVVGALRCAAFIAEELKVDIPLANLWKKEAEKIKDNILEKLWNEDDKRFLRGIRTRLNWWNCDTLSIPTNDMGYRIDVAAVDNVVDISLLGLTIPFGVLDAKDERIKKTVRAIEDHLDGFPAGGFGRYEYDSYIGGNPWVISTLWLGLYYAEIGEAEKCKEKLMWAVKNSTHLGFLPEQVDKFHGGPSWIMQLAWSSAMFIITLDALRK